MREENKKTYYLCDSEFSVLASACRLVSVKRTGDTLSTEYVDEKESFGECYIAYRKAQEEELREFCAQDCEDFADAAPAVENEMLAYRASGSDGVIKAEVLYTLPGGCLSVQLTVENLSGEAVSLTDLGLRFCCHSDFGWGKDASPNVIGHHYAGGNGAHSAWYRVDGSGYALVFAPEGGTALTFIDSFPWVDKEAHKEQEKRARRGVTMLYPFAAARGKRAAQKGARLRIAQEERLLQPGESAVFRFRYFWADSMEEMGAALARNGLVNAISVPGYTVPAGTEVSLCLQSRQEDLCVRTGDGCKILQTVQRDRDSKIVRLVFTKLGEHRVQAVWNGGRCYTDLYYFVTEDIATLWKKRAAFIASKQETDPEKWYRGLFCEWNNETGVRLSPDNYDRIGGWRIYEVSCDDPGLSKPAFLSSKQVYDPDQTEVTALDDYIQYFVWGGLQQTTEEPYPFGIYGIPDWKKLRDSDDPGLRGRLHIWRVYDYSHIALTYYNMYRVASDYPQIKTRLSAEEYLLRAYGTACAMFTVPQELDDWSAVKTGFYNERVIPCIVSALREAGKDFEADRLHIFWMRKVRFFATECKDVFGSEYPFDTTGFESTYYLADDALKAASLEKDDNPWAGKIAYEKAVGFMEKQHRCNLACRGWHEPAYYMYGSDYRGNNTHYLLSYMSQMGGCSVLDHALFYEREPWEMLRLGYGSLLSSYALMNTGTEESNYGYWFPGREHDGAAGGGFEPLYETETWLDQPCSGGSWYYSCEIDLGFCGGTRGACTILADDPLFGLTVYGGRMEQENGSIKVRSEDGAFRRFHWLSGGRRFHAAVERGRFSKECCAVVTDREIRLFLEPGTAGVERELSLSTKGLGSVSVLLPDQNGVFSAEPEKKGDRLILPDEKVTEVLIRFAAV